MATKPMSEPEIKVGDIVRANMFGLGLPYRAEVLEIKPFGKGGERAKIRPLHAVLTEGSARRWKTRVGNSIRARWVRMDFLQTDIPDSELTRRKCNP